MTQPPHPSIEIHQEKAKKVSKSVVFCWFLGSNPDQPADKVDPPEGSTSRLKFKAFPSHGPRLEAIEAGQMSALPVLS